MLKESESEIRSVLPVSCVSSTETHLTVKREDSEKCAERDTHMLINRALLETLN